MPADITIDEDKKRLIVRFHGQITKEDAYQIKADALKGARRLGVGLDVISDIGNARPVSPEVLDISARFHQELMQISPNNFFRVRAGSRVVQGLFKQMDRRHGNSITATVDSVEEAEALLDADETRAGPYGSAGRYTVRAEGLAGT